MPLLDKHLNMSHLWKRKQDGRCHFPGNALLAFRLSLPFIFPFHSSKTVVTATFPVQVQAPSRLYAAQQKNTKVISSLVHKNYTAVWKQWRALFTWLHIPSNIQVFSVPIPFILIFSKHVPRHPRQKPQPRQENLRVTIRIIRKTIFCLRGGPQVGKA